MVDVLLVARTRTSSWAWAGTAGMTVNRTTGSVSKQTVRMRVSSAMAGGWQGWPSDYDRSTNRYRVSPNACGVTAHRRADEERICAIKTILTTIDRITKHKGW